MKFEKKQMAKMPKAYSVSKVCVDGIDRIVVATEKKGPLNLFDTQGNLIETIFDDFGGVMSIVDIPFEDNAFLTTYEFYSPNDGYKAQIVRIKKENGSWTMKTLVELPFVHRFDILKDQEDYYLIACTIKSGFEFKNDWNQAGKIYGAKLPLDLSDFDIYNQLELSVIKDGLSKNHGYSKIKADKEIALVTSVEGVFKVSPGETWELEKILDQSTSDALLCDLDGDGVCELVTISEFHGDHLDIYKDNGSEFIKAFSYEKPLRFLHALHTARINNKEILFVGQREGDRDLFALEYDTKSNMYFRTDIDSDVGVANITSVQEDGQFTLFATHRETDQVCAYKLI